MALKEKRIILTTDLNFGEIAMSTSSPGISVIVKVTGRRLK